jgi:hypothetical protein
MKTTEKRSFTMKSKTLGFAIMTIIILFSISSLALGKSGSYLVPVKISKTDRTLIEGYIVFSPAEIQRLGSWVSVSGNELKRVGRRERPWSSQQVRRNAPGLLNFKRIMFSEGGYEFLITYPHGKKPVYANNFFSRNRIRFTTDASHADVLPRILAPGQVTWIKRTGKAERIK